ncbi:MAG: hypothetical protein NVSMB12_07120 [Acidimicrobiales bacterium]
MSMTPAARRFADPSPDPLRTRSRAGAPAAPKHVPPPAPPLTVLPQGYRSPRTRRRHRRLRVTAGLFAALIGVFSLVVVHVELTANQLRLVHLQQAADAQQQRYLKLRLEVAQLAAPGRVVATAQQLGMVPPATITYLTAVSGAQAAPASSPDTSSALAQAWASTKLNDSRR